MEEQEDECRDGKNIRCEGGMGEWGWGRAMMERAAEE